MRVTVHLHTILQQRTPDGPISKLDMELPDGSTLADLMARLEVRLAPEHLLVAVNGRVAKREAALHEGDEVHVIPAISGGRGK